MTTDQYSSAYYRAAYPIHRRMEERDTNGPVHVLMANKRWTEEGKQRSRADRRAMRHAEGEISEARPVAGYDVFSGRRR